MAPLKFEDKMKEKLEQRAIIPSKDSWDRLANELDNAQNKKKQSKKIWLYSAAAIFIGVLLTSIFINQELVSQSQPKILIVDTKEELVKNEETNAIANENVQENLIKEEKQIPLDQIKGNKVNNISKANQKHTVIAITKNNTKSTNTVASNTTITSNNVFNDNLELKKVMQQEDKGITSVANDILPIDSLVIRDKIANVIAQIEDLEENNIQVTDAEIDKLLMEAQREIATSKIIKSSTVSASALLQDVENELDESFKQRVFDALKKGFQKVRTAVVERDN